MVNYFWLSQDPEECASWYCDQHCFKIGSEVVESVWDSVLILYPKSSGLADEEYLTMAFRRYRHAKPDMMWHPLSVWHGLCRANMVRGLVNADAIFKEHYHRTSTQHAAWKDCKFLTKLVSKINFNSNSWKVWWSTQNGTINPHTPSKTKPADLEKRKLWCDVHAVFDKPNRNTCGMTEPPQCINEALFPGCKIPGNVVSAYRRYYNAKVYSLGFMRYYYQTIIPKWLSGFRETDEKTNKTKVLPWQLDEEGYVMVDFSY